MKLNHSVLRQSLPVLAALACFTTASAFADAIYTVRQTFAVKDLPDGAKQVRGWFWMPEDRPGQKVLEFAVVEAPESLRITRDPGYGRSWLYAEASAQSGKPLQVVTEFKLLRQKISGMADASKTHPLTARHQRAFAAELRKDEKHMEVTPKIQKIAHQLAGAEKNP